MKDKFRLFIDNREVDFTTEPDFPMTYQLEDFSNPTIVKNNFSKNIKIEGTERNNKIFGEIYNLDREQIYSFGLQTGPQFNPSKRTPFALYKNSELLESGYIQLTDITIKNKKITYNITLYGGLGDFFYNLMYNEEGEKLTLADLYYKIEDYNGNVLPKETELDFLINKDFVEDSWRKLYDFAEANIEENTILDFITFAPSYNGLYDDFDNSTILINTHNSEIFNNNNSKVEDSVTYTTYDGFKIAKSEQEYTEWETRDLRSYMQRPAIRLKKIINAICDEDNNGGYKVNLDETFFNEANPHYQKAYMALPLLTTLSTDKEGDGVKESRIFVDSRTQNGYDHLGYKDGRTVPSCAFSLDLEGDITTNGFPTFEIDLNDVPATSTLDVNIDFTLNFVAESLNETMDNSKLYLSYITAKKYTEYPYVTDLKPVYKSIICQAVMYDSEDMNSPRYVSNIINFTSPFNYWGNEWVSTPDKWKNYNPNTDLDYLKTTMINCFGSFVRQGNTNNYKWVSNEGFSTFKLDIKDIPRRNKMRIAILFQLVYSEYDANTMLIPINQQIFYGTHIYPSDPTPSMVKGYAVMPLSSSSKLLMYENVPTVKSNSEITKKVLLKTEFSPVDVLLDYCKLFGLLFTKDIHSRTINIMTKNTFFKNNIIDINERIDWSQDMKISPYLFESKYYLMNYEETDTHFEKKYKNEYNLIYGQKRIDTNYNFNKDTSKIYEGNVFQNSLTVTDSSPYYRTFHNKDGKQIPSWALDSPKMLLFDGVGTSDMDNVELDFSLSSNIDYSNITSWNIKSGYDIFPKNCFYSLDNNSKSLCDLSSTLFIFNGFQPTTDINGEQVAYWVTDDLFQMSFLNDNTMCWIYTESNTDIYQRIIAHKQLTLPQFIRYSITGSKVNEGFDFGLPKEVYIPNLDYQEGATIYNNFWKNYLSDRYDVNTKKVNCYVNLEGMVINQDSLRNFYYFSNSIWVINKIENYYPNSYKPTKVEFVKVNDINNYLNGQKEYYYPNVILSEYDVTVDYNTTSYTIELECNDKWEGTAKRYGTSMTPTSGDSGTFSVVLNLNENTAIGDINNVFTFRVPYYGEKRLTITQTPNPETTCIIYGYVYDKKTQQAIQGAEIIVRDTFTDDYSVENFAYSNYEGYYEVYALKEGNDIGYAYLEVWINGENVYQTMIDETYFTQRYRQDIIIE